jgi:Fic family protein
MVDKKPGEPFVPEALPPRLDWEGLIPLIGSANRAIAAYNGTLYALPNRHLLLSPLTIQEAVLSSKIEGTQATVGDVLRFEAGEEPTERAKLDDIREVINYRRALGQAVVHMETRPFNLNLLLELHATLLDSVRGQDKARGRFRTIQNWVGPANCPIEEAFFVPPEPQSVLRLLDEWERYYHADEKDPLVQLAIVHAQFEIIHPFLDGNGRLGRILIPLFLAERGVLGEPMFYLSGYLEEHREEYVQRLRDLGAPGSWNRWVQFFLGAIIEQAHANAKAARAILDLYDRLKIEVREATHSQYAVTLLDHIYRQPVFQASEIADRPSMPSKQMTNIMLKQLVDRGVLAVVREGRGRRSAVLALPALLNICEGREVLPPRSFEADARNEGLA